MGLKVFSIFDSKAGVYARPFCMTSAGTAMRVFGDMANDENDPVGQHAEDYTLFEIGTFDEDRGLIVSEATPRSLCNGIELKLAPQTHPMTAAPYVDDETLNQHRREGNGTESNTETSPERS